MSKDKKDEHWKRYCPHDECPHYKGMDILCDWIGAHCEIHAPGKGLPGFYKKGVYTTWRERHAAVQKV